MEGQQEQTQPEGEINLGEYFMSLESVVERHYQQWKIDHHRALTNNQKETVITNVIYHLLAMNSRGELKPPFAPDNLADIVADSINITLGRIKPNDQAN